MTEASIRTTTTPLYGHNPRRRASKEERAHARSLWTASKKRLQHVASRARGRELLSEDEIENVSALLKGDRREDKEGLAGLEEAVRKADALADELSVRLPENERTPEHSDLATPAKTKSRRIRVRELRTLALLTGKAEGSTRPSTRPVSPLEVVGDPERLSKFTKDTQVFELMNVGASAREAIQAVGEVPKRSEIRRVQRMFERAKGRSGSVLDMRYGRVPERHALTDAVQALIQYYLISRPAAPASTIYGLMMRHFDSAGPDQLELPFEDAQIALPAEPPTLRAVQGYIAELPKAFKYARDGQWSEWTKNSRFTIRREEASFGNEQWQIDHHRLDVHIRVEVAPGEWTNVDVNLTAVLDVFSRAIVGWVISILVPSAWTILRALRKAIIGVPDDPSHPMRGVPDGIHVDNGADFKSWDLGAAVQAVGIQRVFSRPHRPNDKGKIERVFLTLQHRLAGLPGYMGAGRSDGSAKKKLATLLTLDQLERFIGDFVREYNNRCHSSTGRVPRELWEESVRLRVADTERLQVLLQKSDVRKVTKEGVRLTYEDRGGQYYSYELLDYVGHEVVVRFDPEGMHEVTICDPSTDEPLCVARLLGDPQGVTADEIADMNREYIAQLTKRTKEFRREAERHDRQSAAAVTEARELAHQMRSELAGEPIVATEVRAMEALRAAFEGAQGGQCEIVAGLGFVEEAGDA